jgi:cytidine deaminase
MASKININTSFIHYNSLNELPLLEKSLCEKARQILVNAYAPYSKFYVGAALLLEDGTIVTGTNQENAAYPSGLCAERVAIFYASSIHPTKKISCIAIAYKNGRATTNTKPISPCGSCRQAIAEYEVKFKSPIKILMLGENDEVYESESIANLLPLMFDGSSLN